MLKQGCSSLFPLLEIQTGFEPATLDGKSKLYQMSYCNDLQVLEYIFDFFFVIASFRDAALNSETSIYFLNPAE